jgi:hypothetical protein
MLARKIHPHNGSIQVHCSKFSFCFPWIFSFISFLYSIAKMHFNYQVQMTSTVWLLMARYHCYIVFASCIWLLKFRLPACQQEGQKVQNCWPAKQKPDQVTLAQCNGADSSDQHWGQWGHIEQCCCSKSTPPNHKVELHQYSTTVKC